MNTLQTEQVLRRYDIASFIIMWVIGWLLMLGQSISPVINASIDQTVTIVIALLSILVMYLLSNLRIAL